MPDRISATVSSLCLLALGLIYLPPNVTCQTVAEAKALRTKLFVTDGYDVKVRPANNQSTPTSVTVVLELISINNLVAVSETFITTAGLKVKWKDEQLVWTPATYGGISEYRWPQDDVWRPPIALANSVTGYTPLGDSSLHVLVNNDGTVQWSALNVFQSTCAMNVRYYPFDVQTCQLQFIAWGYMRAQVDILSTGNGFDMEEYHPSPSWDLLDGSWFLVGDEDDVAITFTIKVRRKPMFIVMTTIIPVILLAILNLFVFLIPCDEGEKAGYSMTVLLSMAIFLTIIASTLPDHSDEPSILSIYLTLLTTQSAMITMAALTMLRCNSFSEERKIPTVLLWAMCVTRMKTCRSRNKTSAVKCNEIKSEKSENRPDSKTCLKEAKENVEEDEHQTRTAWTKSYTWKEAMVALDALLFVVFLVILTTSTIACMCVAAYGDG